MADFGKINRSAAFNPTSAFPLDARAYFESYASAAAAAAKAEAVGSANTVHYYGQKLLVYEGGACTWYTIQPGGTLKAEGSGGNATLPELDDTLKIDSATGKLGVNMATEVADKTLPITAAAVNTTVGNIEVLLQTI